MTNEELVAKIQSGIETKENMLQLYDQNQGIIYKTANRYMSIVEKEELLQEAYIALSTAVKHFDAGQDIKFSTYIGFILKQHFQRYVYENNSMHIPEYMSVLIGRYKIFSDTFMKNYGRKPTDAEVMKGMNLKLDKLQWLKTAARMKQATSLDEDVWDDENHITLADMIVAEGNLEEEVLERVHRQQLESTIWTIVDSLPAEKAYVIRARYQDNKTRKAIGEHLGATIDKVLWMEQGALQDLRRGKRGKVIRGLCDEEIYNCALRGTGISSFRSTWTSATERTAIECW